MIRFGLYTPDNAPAAARPLLQRLKAGFGFLPSLFAQMAESATALAAYLDLRSHFERSSLTPVEQQVVALAVSVENGSPFCTSAHSFAARRVAGVPDAVVDALRDGRPLPDPRLEVLAGFTRELVRRRGRIDRGDLNVFLAAGFGAPQVLEVILGVALKTFTNYASQVVRPPLNAEFASESWTPPPSSEEAAIRALVAEADRELGRPRRPEDRDPREPAAGAGLHEAGDDDIMRAP